MPAAQTPRPRIFRRPMAETPRSNGSQKSYSGYDTSKVYANTDATQINKVMVDQHQEVVAGIGGDGGDGNFAWGGGVTFHLDTL